LCVTLVLTCVKQFGLVAYDTKTMCCQIMTQFQHLTVLLILWQRMIC